MVRSPLTLCAFLLGILGGVVATVGHERYGYILLALAVPWDKLGTFTGDLVEQLVMWRRQRQMEKGVLVYKEEVGETETFSAPAPAHEGPVNGRGSYQRQLHGQGPTPLVKRAPRRS
jgi:hypothetical protein